jgi:hypothetical protein
MKTQQIARWFRPTSMLTFVTVTTFLLNSNSAVGETVTIPSLPPFCTTSADESTKAKCKDIADKILEATGNQLYQLFNPTIIYQQER